MTSPSDTGDDLLNALVRTAPTGVVVFDREGVITLVNPSALNLMVRFARNADTGNFFRLFGDAVPNLKAAVEEAAAGSEPVVERQELSPHGDVLRACVVDLTVHRVGSTTFIAHLDDRSESRALSGALSRLERQFRALVDGSSDLSVIAASEDGLIETWDLASTKMFGYREDEIVGRPIAELFAPADLGELATLGSIDARTLHVQHRLEKARESGWHGDAGWLLRRDGQRFWANSLVNTHPDDTHGGFTVVLRDLTNHSETDDRLRALETRDPLTGVANRRHFLEAAASEHGRWRRYGAPLSLLMAEVDGLGALLAGKDLSGADAALTCTAAICRKMVREVDLVARLEGPTIVVLLPSTPLNGARVIGERIRVAVANAGSNGRDAQAPSTISVGAAELGPKGSLYDLLACAEAAMTRARQDGGNRVVVDGK